MKRINLQLFAYDPNSIVDYLKSTGSDSSYSARKELAASMGISNYSGTASQNTQMLNALKNNNKSNSASSSSNNNQKTDNTTNPNVTTSIVSPSGTLGPADYTASGSSNKKKKSSSDSDSGFKASSAYLDAMEQTNATLAQLNSGKTTYADQIKQMIKDIQNRDPFSYDLSNDTLFQQSLASAMASGKTAMQDTMGQAAALTGGYGSTYATAAANQQYNAFIEDAYNNLPEYYQLALDAYRMQGEDMYNQLAMMTEADANEFDRLYNTFNANASYAQQLYGNEYGEYIDSLNNEWREKEYDLSKEQYASDLEFKYASMAQDKEMYESDLKYKYDALAQDQAQFNAQMAAKKSSSGSSGSSSSKKSSPSGTGKVDTLTNAEVNAIKSAYIEAGGGESGDAAVDAYLSAIGKNNVDPDAVWTILSGISMEEELEETPFYNMDWTISKDSINWIWGDDNDDRYTNGETEMTYKELKEAIEDTDLDAYQKKAFLEKLKKQSK